MSLLSENPRLIQGSNLQSLLIIFKKDKHGKKRSFYSQIVIRLLSLYKSRAVQTIKANNQVLVSGSVKTTGL